VAPLRRALLLDENRETEDVHRALADVAKKIWNARNFKGHSSPHEFMQAVRNRSKDAFGAETGIHDAAQFLRWLLNELIRDEKKRGNASVVQSCFQGEVEIIDDSSIDRATETSTSRASPFLMLSMDLPNAPLFQDVMEKNIIPQVSFERALLKKFDGVTADPKTQRRFKITKLPNYLIVNYSRFTKNNFFVEKNPTIVTFPTRGLNLADHIPVPKGDENSATYDLIANIVHDGTPDNGSYRAMVYHAPDKNWYETQDLRVAEVLPQQVNLTETYVQIYERRDKR
jgi:U4/U6.U5 tri-snRNP-associated protein 2